MQIDVYAPTGQKAGTLDLPKELFGAPINQGLMHQAVTMQQGNRRHSIAHAKSRGEVAGSTRKLYGQKHTGRARRGSVRSPLLRGGGKAFGPRSVRNFHKDMPRAMRHAALRSSLSYQARKGTILGLQSYPDAIKTKEAAILLEKLPVQVGRSILIVTPAQNRALWLSTRNIPRVKTIVSAYLNPLDILSAHHVIFLAGAVEKAMEVFGRTKARAKKLGMEDAVPETKPEKVKKPKQSKKSTTAAKVPKKKSSSLPSDLFPEASAKGEAPAGAKEGASSSSSAS